MCHQPCAQCAWLRIEHVDLAGARESGLMRKVRLSHESLLVVVKCGWLVASRWIG
jgi:hypothetical protein